MIPIPPIYSIKDSHRIAFQRFYTAIGLAFQENNSKIKELDSFGVAQNRQKNPWLSNYCDIRTQVNVLITLTYISLCRKHSYMFQFVVVCLFEQRYFKHRKAAQRKILYTRLHSRRGSFQMKGALFVTLVSVSTSIFSLKVQLHLKLFDKVSRQYGSRRPYWQIGPSPSQTYFYLLGTFRFSKFQPMLFYCRS